DVRPQGVERHAAFAIPLGPGNLDAVQAPCTHDLDALRTQTHRVLDRPLHGTPEHDPLFELLRDRVRDQLCVNLWFANFFDIDVNRHAHELLQLTAQILNV